MIQNERRTRTQVESRKMEAQIEQLELKEAQLLQLMQDSGLVPDTIDEIKNRVKESIENKNHSIKNLRYSINHATKAYNDAIRVYEAKLVQFGIPSLKNLAFSLQNYHQLYACWLRVKLILEYIQKIQINHKIYCQIMKSEEQEALTKQVQKNTKQLINKINKQYKKIQFSLDTPYMSGELNQLSLPKIAISKNHQDALPDNIRNKTVCRVSIYTIQSYNMALNSYDNFFKDQKNVDRQKQYEERNFKQRSIYLTENQVIFQEFIDKKLQIAEYEHIFIQERNQYEQLRKQMNDQEKKLESMAKKQEGNFLPMVGEVPVSAINSFQKAVINSKQSVKNNSFVLIQNWKIPNADSKWRIICMPKNHSITSGFFYVYFSDYFEEQNKEILSKKTSEILKDRFVLAHMTSKHEKKLVQLSKKYISATKFKINNQSILTILRDNYVVSESKPIKLPENIFQNYQSSLIKNFVSNWKKNVENAIRSMKTYLFIEPIQIIIPKSLLPTSVIFSLNQYDGINCEFIEQSANYLIFQPVKKNHLFQNYSIDLHEYKNRTIKFLLKVTNKKGKTQRFKNSVKMSKIENQSLGFAYQLGLIPEDENSIQENFKGNFPYLVKFQTLVHFCQGSIRMEVNRIRKINLITKLGKIPNLYSTYFQYNFNPADYSLVQQILCPVQLPLTQYNFQQVYLKFVQFFHSQENSSQNFCLYLSFKKYKGESSGFLIKDRYFQYKAVLKQQIQSVRQTFEQIFKQKQVSVYKTTKKKQIANLKDDLQRCSSYNKEKIEYILQRYIIYCDYLNCSGQNTKQLAYTSGLVAIAHNLIQIYDRQYDEDEVSHLKMNQLLYFFIGFIRKIYPFTSLSRLKKELYQIRALSQKYLPQFNRKLNRLHIGLQNFISEYFIKLFTNLPMELSFRIWDYLIKISFDSKKLGKSYAIISFTLMLYLQKIDMKPIWPINKVIDSIEVNMYKVKLEQTTAHHFGKIMDEQQREKRDRRKKIAEMCEQKYLRRFIYGRNLKQIQILDEQEHEVKQAKAEERKKASNMQMSIVQEKVQNKLLSMNELSYPLPKPSYNGYPVSKVHILLSGLFLLGNFNMHQKNYELTVSLSNDPTIKTIKVNDKHIFLNKFYTFPVTAHQYYLMFAIRENDREILHQQIPLSQYHKDIAYRENIVFQQVKQAGLSNKGQSILSISVAVHSARKDKIDAQLNIEDQVIQFEKLLDYDIRKENNDAVRAMSMVIKSLNKIKNPLDQMEQEQYQNLRVSAGEWESYEPEWIVNSKVSVEQLKAIFNTIFIDENQKHLRLNFPNFYENYSKGFQSFYLGSFLLELILMCPISRVKKMSMLYCLGVHYQNISQKEQKMTIQTLNSIIREIINLYGSLNACPYWSGCCGQIVSGCFYEKGNKVNEKKKDITDVLRDWAYLCQRRYRYGGMMLGLATDLSVLRAMLPSSTLIQIEKQDKCRFQIVYRQEDNLFMWAATVNTKDFSIVTRGVKFLNTFPKYNHDLEYLDSVGEVLLNCENILPLQSSKSISFGQFTRIFRENSFLNYLLTEDLHQINTIQKQIMQINPYHDRMSSSVSSSWNENHRIVESKFIAYGLYRHQNCLESWRKCRVVPQNHPNPSYRNIQFQHSPSLYEVPNYEVISLDETHQQPLEQSQFTQFSIASKISR